MSLGELQATIDASVNASVFGRTTLARDNNCSAFRVHNAFVHLHFTDDATVGEIVTMRIVPYIGMAVSLAIAVAGFLILRPSIMLITLAWGFVAALHMFYVYAEWMHNWNCDAVIGGAVAAGAVLSLVSATIVKSVSGVMGAMAGASLVTLFFDICESCNDEPWTNAPTFLDRQLVPFWLAFAIMAAVGWFVCRGRHDQVVAIVTAIIGGWGTSMSIRLAAGSARARLPGWSRILISSVVVAVGFGVQVKLLSRRKERREKEQKGVPQIALVSSAPAAPR